MTQEVTSVETAPRPTLEDNLSLWEERIDRLATEAPNITGHGQYPEWWFQDSERMKEIKPQLEDEGSNLGSSISKYYELFVRERDLQTAVTGHIHNNHPLQQLAGNLGEEFLGRAFAAEPQDGVVHKAMLEDLEHAPNRFPSTVTQELNVLRVAYGLQGVTDLLGVGGDEYSDNLRALLLQPNSIHWMHYAEQVRDDDGNLLLETQEDRLNWMSKVVEAATGMPASEASDYVFSASRSGNDEDTIGIIKMFDHFGVDRIRELAKATGIHGLEAYSIEQLERMEEFVHNPGQVAERLADSDVIVVMINRFGDHNGVMHDVATNFDDDKNRVLFFEITSLGDIYRHAVALRKAGIKPSTLVLAAHSNPGEFMVSDIRGKDKSSRRRDIASVAGRKLVARVNAERGLDDGDFGYSMHGMKGLSRLVETYMQPSRAIDDNDTDTGRKKIIFQACHGASEVKVVDLNDNDKEVQISMQSVISQLGNDLIASGVKTNIDIYGAPGRIQLHRNGRGVHYTGQPTSSDGSSLGRPHLSAERVRVENGQLTKQEVHDIPLRKQ